MSRIAGVVFAFGALAAFAAPAAAQPNPVREKARTECIQQVRSERLVSRMTFRDRMRTCVRSKLDKA